VRIIGFTEIDFGACKPDSDTAQKVVCILGPDFLYDDNAEGSREDIER
jgi:hypothetical protein